MENLRIDVSLISKASK